MAVLLTLDLATKTGFALSCDGVLQTSGVFKFKSSKEDPVKVLIQFRAALEDLKAKHGKIDTIVYERVDFCRFRLAYAMHCRLLATLQLFCADNGIKLESASVAALKRYATGFGRADKEEMVLAAGRHYPEVEIKDDNHADALIIMAWASKKPQV